MTSVYIYIYIYESLYRSENCCEPGDESFGEEGRFFATTEAQWRILYISNLRFYQQIADLAKG
jgi:hypothetical protein